MKEIIALHRKILAEAPGPSPEEGYDFSRDEASEEVTTLPETLQAEITAVQQALNGVVPPEFDYFVFVGGEEPPELSFTYEQMPAGKAAGEEFDPERSVVEQVRAVDWEEQRELATQCRAVMNNLLEVLERQRRALPSVKGIQREYREEMKDFVREKRADATLIHVLYVQDDEALMEAEFATLAELQDALLDLLADDSEVITVVANSKPLPVEKIDALQAAAWNIYRQASDTPEAGSAEGTAETNTPATNALNQQTEDRSPTEQ